MSGIFLSIRKPIHPDDVVKIKDFMGTVEEINLRDTVIKTFQGQMVIIPNKEILQSPIENYTLLGKRRVDLTGRVSFGEDLEKVKKIALDAVENIEGLSDDPTTLFYTEFGDSSVHFVLRLWVDTAGQGSFLKVRSDAIVQIKKAFNENNVLIPFPIRTLDFGAKGGTPLQEMQIKVNHIDKE
ncbi:MAG: mechanosensitive ion channel domain-containing protein, partial [Ginsengibacter sp.]